MEKIIRDMNVGWRFHLGDIPEAWQKAYTEEAWEEVTLPHDWSIGRPLDRGSSSGTGYVVGGIGWYRLHFSLPESWQGKNLMLQFDGVYKNSQVWINGYALGKRPFGYIPFEYDVTAFANVGDRENVLSVRVAHEDVADSRWYTGSGITRKVVLRAYGPVVPLENGIFFETESVSPDGANVRVSNELSASEDLAGVLLRNRFKDAEGQTVLSMESTVDFKKGVAQMITHRGTFASPLLWSVEQPNLYRMETVVLLPGAPEEELDSVKVGIRTIRFDADEGFFLNDKPELFKGVCVHHDGGCLGAAMSKGVWRRRLEKLKSTGCNAIRMSHNPHMPELYDLCDEMGFLVIDEAFDEWEAPKNKWHKGHNVYPPKHEGYAEDFPEWHERDLTAMVRRDRNHPSVVMWSIGNEIDYPNDPYCHPHFSEMTGNNDKNKPATERKYNPDRPNAERLTVLARRLAGIVRTSDGSRPVTAAVAFPELSTRIGFIDDLDVVGYNYKEHLYEADHVRFPHKPFLGSENSHRYDAWRAVTDNPYISGQFLWTGIDYLGECRGWPFHGAQAGILTTAGFEKPDFYLRKSWWSEAPAVRLATTRKLDGDRWNPLHESWDYVPGEMVEIRCHTNQPDVVLMLDGVPLEGECGTTDKGYRAWRIPFAPGVLEARSEKVSHQLVSVSAPVRIHLEKLDEAYGRPGDEGMDDILQVEVSVLDGQNRLVATDRSLISVHLEGDGVLLGLDNGDLSDVTDYGSGYRSAYQGRLMAYVRKTGSGTLKLVAESMTLQSAEVEWQ